MAGLDPAVSEIRGSTPRMTKAVLLRFRQLEYLPGVDQVRVADPLAIRRIDRGIAHAIAIHPASHPPQAVAAPDDIAARVAQAGPGRRLEWRGNAAEHAAIGGGLGEGQLETTGDPRPR